MKIVFINGEILSRIILRMKKYCFYFNGTNLSRDLKNKIGKRNKFYNLSCSDIISKKYNQFLTYLENTHPPPLTIFYAKTETDENIFNITLYRTCYVIEI